LTYVRELVNNDKIFYSPFPLIKYNGIIPVYKNKSKICAIYGNKFFNRPGELYTARRQQILSWGKEIDLYGRGWQEDREILDTVNWCGPWNGNKIELLSRYKYTICYENMNIEGYCSEKLPDAIQAGCIPIHRGWELDYPLTYAFEDNWIKLVYKHILEVI
jgi:hypothetical protein